MGDTFDLDKGRFINALWLVVDAHRETLTQVQMAEILEDFVRHLKTGVDDLPGDDFDAGRVSADTEVSDFYARLDSVRRADRDG